MAQFANVNGTTFLIPATKLINPELFIRVLLEKLARHVKKGALLKMAAIFLIMDLIIMDLNPQTHAEPTESTP
jgi:hypothetical protein